MLKELMLDEPPFAGRLRAARGWPARGARFALIGHSGSGKSSCLLELGYTLASADMDKVVGTDGKWRLEDMPDWFSKAPLLVVLSLEDNKLDRLMKLARKCGIRLIYLHHTKEALAENLRKCQADGNKRSDASIGYTLETYENRHRRFEENADRKICCSGNAVASVAAEVAGVMEGVT